MVFNKCKDISLAFVSDTKIKQPARLASKGEGREINETERVRVGESPPRFLLAFVRSPFDAGHKVKLGRQPPFK